MEIIFCLFRNTKKLRSPQPKFRVLPSLLYPTNLSVFYHFHQSLIAQSYPFFIQPLHFILFHEERSVDSEVEFLNLQPKALITCQNHYAPNCQFTVGPMGIFSQNYPIQDFIFRPNLKSRKVETSQI